MLLRLLRGYAASRLRPPASPRASRSLCRLSGHGGRPKNGGDKSAVRSLRGGNALAPVAGFEVREVMIPSAYGGLDRVVKHLEAAGRRHVDQTPYRGPDVFEADAQARDGLRCHPAILPAKLLFFVSLRANRACAVQAT